MELREKVIEKLEEAMMLSEAANECKVTLGYGVVEDILALLKAQETNLEKVADDYGLTIDGVAFALEQYQTIICEITHGMMSKLTYRAHDVLQTAQERWCDICELKEAQEPHIMTLEELVAWQKQPIMARDPIYVEYREGKGFGAPHWAMDNFGFNVASCRDNYRAGVYGILLRCWTSRPDEKRRAETPWN